MLNKFAVWFTTYNVEITWALIGWLAFAMFDSLGRGNYISALVDAILIALNYSLRPRR